MFPALKTDPEQDSDLDLRPPSRPDSDPEADPDLDPAPEPYSKELLCMAHKCIAYSQLFLASFQSEK